MIRLGLAVLSVAVVVSATTAMSASNTVATTRLDQITQAITPNSLKPSQCSSLNLANLVTSNAATINGTNSADLILAGASVNAITARNGSDCVLAGGGNDAIDGGNGTDVCLGGPGTDTFANCETQIP